MTRLLEPQSAREQEWLSAAVGAEACVVQTTIERVIQEFNAPWSRRDRFATLRDEWLAGTEFSSSFEEIVLHPAYQRIIGMGPRALRPILRELRQNVEHWGWALSAITGEDPVPPTSRGNLREIRDAWLRWAGERGLLD
ncbi:MAG: hypothetical protein ACKVWV_05220 [Planctomycetota bacterium]